MPTVSDSIKQATGGLTVSQGLFSYYGGLPGQTIDEACYQFLLLQGVGPGNINDMWHEFLHSMGYVGTTNDMLHQFWCVDGGEAIRTMFKLGEDSDLNLERGEWEPTFIRGSEATVIDHEGLVRAVPDNCALRYGARIVENVLVASEDLSDGSWIKTAAITINQDGTLQTSGSGSYVYALLAVAAGNIYSFRFEVTNLPGPASFAIYDDTNAAWIQSPQEYPVSNGVVGGDFTAPPGCSAVRFHVFRATVDTVFDQPYSVSKIQIENVTGQANQAPSEYVSTGVGTGDEEILNGEFETDTDWIENDDAIATYSAGEVLVENGSAVYSEIYQVVSGIPEGLSCILNLSYKKGNTAARVFVRDGAINGAALVNIQTASASYVTVSTIFVTTGKDLYVAIGPNG